MSHEVGVLLHLLDGVGILGGEVHVPDQRTPDGFAVQQALGRTEKDLGDAGGVSWKTEIPATIIE